MGGQDSPCCALRVTGSPVIRNGGSGKVNREPHLSFARAQTGPDERNGRILLAIWPTAGRHAGPFAPIAVLQ